MAFEPLVSGLTWIFVVMIPLALFIVLFDSNADTASPSANTSAAHFPGDADSRSASDSQSPSPSPSPERRRPCHRPPVPLAPTPPPRSTAPGSPPTPSSRRTYAMNTHIDQLMIQRQIQAVFEDNSDFDFHLGDEDEYQSDEEEEISFYCSSQHHRHDRDRYRDSQDGPAPSLNRDFSGSFITTAERPSATAAAAATPPSNDHQSRKTPVSHNNTVMKEVLQQLDQESTAKASARAAARAVAQIAAAANSKAKQKPPLPWRPTRPPMKQRVPRETLSPGTGRDDIADSPSSARAQKDTSNGHSLLASQDSSKPTPDRPSSSIPARSRHNGKSNSSPTGRQASINTHIDALMRQHGIQHTNWAHVDMPFERSAAEHQFQDVESHIRAEGEDPGDVDPREGSEAEARKTYFYQRASQKCTLDGLVFAPLIPTPPFTPPVSPAPQPPSHDEYANPCNPASRSFAAASSYHSTVDVAWESELATSETEVCEITHRGDNAPLWRRPAKLREQEHDELGAIPLPSNSAPDDEDAASRDVAWTRVHQRSEQKAQRGLSPSFGPVPTQPVRVLGGMVDVGASKGKGRASSSMDPEIVEYMYELVRERQEQAQQQQEAASETARPELNREAARITSMILPYTHRYDAGRDLLASSVPPASASASTPCRRDSQPQLQKQPPPRKQLHFSRSAPSASTSQLLYAEDPVFGTGALPIDALSPSVARQVEMRAGGVLSLQYEDEFNSEQDWSDDEYRYGDVAGNDHDDDWTEMPSDR